MKVALRLAWALAQLVAILVATWTVTVLLAGEDASGWPGWWRGVAAGCTIVVSSQLVQQEILALRASWRRE